MDPTTRFAAVVETGEWPLDELSALIAAHARPIEVDDLLLGLDDLALGLTASSAEAVMDGLFASGPFRGNVDDYYDPDNSFLDQVLVRHLGIPITLSLLAVEVGRRRGVRLVVVGMPGHVLVRERSDVTRFWDPFDGGRPLDMRGVEDRFRSIHGDRVPFDAAMTRPIPNPAVVERLLANLAAIYASRRDVASVMWVDRLRALVAGSERANAGLN